MTRLRSLVFPLAAAALTVVACRTVEGSGPSIVDSVIEGIRPLDGGLVEVVAADGGSQAFPAGDFIPPFCDAKVNPAIPFPDELRDAGIVGEVQVQCVVLTTGFQRDCRVLQGVGAMDPIVLNAVKTWRCVPAILRGIPVASQHVTFVAFKPKPPPVPAVVLPEAPELPALPHGLPDVKSPEDNPTTKEKVLLGNLLFHDPRLSKDGTQSCESCHHVAQAWTSGQALDAKVGGAMNKRNAPTMTNLGYHPALYWDGRMPTLEACTNAAWKGQLGADPEKVVKALNAVPAYQAHFDRAFGTHGGATVENVPRALAAFLRALTSGDSPWDRFMAGDKVALSKDAQAGWALFQKSGCVACHVPPLFTDFDYHALGVNDDSGRKDATKLDADVGKFKTPTLRNVARTAPYFHDGSQVTLADAIAFMAKGANAKPGAEPKLKPVKLSKKDAAALEAFLQSLSAPSTFEAAPTLP